MSQQQNHLPGAFPNEAGRGAECPLSELSSSYRFPVLQALRAAREALPPAPAPADEQLGGLPADLPSEARRAA